MESQSLQLELNQWGYSNATAMVNTSRKPKSKQGGGSWAPLDELTRGVITQILPVQGWSHSPTSWSHPWQLSEITGSRQSTTKGCESLEGHWGKDRCCFAAPQIPGTSPPCGQCQSWEGCSSSAKPRSTIRGCSCHPVQGSRLPSLGAESWRVCSSKVCRNTGAVDKLKGVQFAKCCRTRSRGNW